MNNNILNSTYIGDIKISHKGGYKIISGSKDDYIIRNRNIILEDLSNIFKGGKQLIYEDIPYYVQALEGKYLRNKINKGGNVVRDNVRTYYKKLIKKSIKEYNDLNGGELLSIVKEGSPYLFKRVASKYNFLGGNISESGIKTFIDSNIFNLETFENSLISLESLYKSNNLLCNNPNKDTNYTINPCKDTSNYSTIYHNLKKFAKNNWVLPKKCEKKQFSNICENINNVIKRIAPDLYFDLDNLDSHISKNKGGDNSSDYLSSDSSSSIKSLSDYYTQNGGKINSILLNKLRYSINKIRGSGNPL